MGRDRQGNSGAGGRPSDYAALLEALRWHWGSAYMVYRVGPDHWLAMRRDDYTPLHAKTPELLNGMMRADYTARPVPRGC